MVSQKEDLKFGTASEQNNKAAVEALAVEPMIWRGGYSLFDYCNKECTIYVELKTRRIAHDDYGTALIGKNKVDFCCDDTKKYYFMFSYTDGNYFIKYSKDLFNSFDTNDSYKRGERNDCVNRADYIMLIPTELLVKLE